MKLNNLLKYLIKEDIEEGIRNIKFAPTPFNMREFKELDDLEDIHWYVEDRLEEIGEGSGRKVFILSSRFALKIASLADEGYDGAASSEEKGLAQNEVEFNTYMGAKDRSIIPKVQDCHPRFLWLIVELVRPIKNQQEFKKLTGFDEHDMLNIVDAIRHNELHGDEHSSPIVKGMIYLARNHNISPSDMYSVRQWGKTTDGRVVLLDTGATYDVLENLYEQTEHEIDDLPGLINLLVHYNLNKNHPVLINAIRALEDSDLNHALSLIKNDRDKFEPDERAWLRNMGLL